jgi:hypothetical protein
VEILRPASEEEAEAAFLRAELASPRFREEILAGRRGWRVGGLFHGFPDDLEWSRVALDPAEVLEIRYIDWDWWLMASGGTRSPVDAAARIRAGEIAGMDAESHRSLAARLRSDDPPAELIAVTTGPGAPLVLVEGHARLTAYALYPEYLPRRLEILLGVSPRVSQWSEWGFA